MGLGSFNFLPHPKKNKWTNIRIFVSLFHEKYTLSPAFCVESDTSNESVQSADSSLNLLLPTVVIEKLNDENCANILNKQQSPTKGCPPVEESAIETDQPEPPSTPPENEPVAEDVRPGPVTRSASPKKSPPRKDAVLQDEVVEVEEPTTTPVDCATAPVPQAQIEADNSVHEDAPESQHDTSDDVDFVCTNDGEVPQSTNYLRLCSRLSSIRPPATSLCSPPSSITTVEAACSPEIITVDKDEMIAAGDASVAPDVEKEHSISIFSPEATCRTGQPEECSQSLLDASERLTSDAEDTVTDLNENRVDEGPLERVKDETEEVLRRMARVMWEPVLQHDAISAVTQDRDFVFAACSNAFRSFNDDLRAKIGSGTGLDLTVMRRIGLVDLVKTVEELIAASK